MNSSHPYVRIDPQKFNDVVKNLVANAIKYCPSEDGLVIASVSTSAEVHEVSLYATPHHARLVGTLRVQVSDNGSGISPENIHKVFGELAQFDKNKLQGGGSGLGLWLSRRIISLHGGTLNCTSEGLGKGCTFYLCLPIYDVGRLSRHPYRLSRLYSWLFTPRIDPFPNYEMENSVGTSSVTAVHRRGDVENFAPSDSQEEEPPDEQVEDAVSSRSSRYITPIPYSDYQRLKVLIVDDSSMNRHINMRVVAAESEAINNPIIVEADDGDTAVSLVVQSIAEGTPFDVILLDSIMNRMDGPIAANTLRTQHSYVGLIIGVTGNGLPEDIDNFISHGANHVLVKPLKGPKLVSLLRSEGLIER